MAGLFTIRLIYRRNQRVGVKAQRRLRRLLEHRSELDQIARRWRGYRQMQPLQRLIDAPLIGENEGVTALPTKITAIGRTFVPVKSQRLVGSCVPAILVV